MHPRIQVEAEIQPNPSQNPFKIQEESSQSQPKAEIKPKPNQESSQIQSQTKPKSSRKPKSESQPAQARKSQSRRHLASHLRCSKAAHLERGGEGTRRSGASQPMSEFPRISLGFWDSRTPGFSKENKTSDFRLPRVLRGPRSS